MSTSTEAKEGIDQVREILVGAMQREFERKLARLESHLSGRVSELQQEGRRRLEVIEAHLRAENHALSSRLDGELTEMREALRALTLEQREGSTGAAHRVAKLEETVVRSQHDLRTQILEQAKVFLDELQSARDEFSETLEREHELGSWESASAEESNPNARQEGREAH
jgi:hypothetical protein